MTYEELADIMACEGVEYTVLHKCSIQDFEDPMLRTLVIRFQFIRSEIEARVKANIPDDHEFQTY